MKHIILIFSLLVIFTPASSFAASQKSGGDEFRETAKEYDIQAKKSHENGEKEKAQAYARMAEIKREAATLADQGKWSEINWTEYFLLLKSITYAGS